MINKTDALILLSELKQKGVDTNQIVVQLLKLQEPSLEILKFINQNKPLDLLNFYEKIRKSYNDGRSKLYKNIVSENIDDPKTMITTLSALQLQILLFANSIDDKAMFLRHARLEEISACLLDYAKTSNLINCQKLLKIIKIDLKACEAVRLDNA